jgi:hypothetical protein
MSSYRAQFSMGSEFNTNIFGTVTGTLTGVQFPNVPCSVARLHAFAANTSPFYIGHSSTIYPYELSAGDDTGWFSIGNLNTLYGQAPSGTNAKVAYWIQK